MKIDERVFFIYYILIKIFKCGFSNGLVGFNVWCVDLLSYGECIVLLRLGGLGRMWIYVG